MPVTNRLVLFALGFIYVGLGFFWPMMLMDTSYYLGVAGLVATIILGIITLFVALRLGGVSKKLDGDTKEILWALNRSLVEQKIATLNSYVGDVSLWPSRGVNVDRITADIRAIIPVQLAMSSEERERLNDVVRKITDRMKGTEYETQIGKIESVMKVL